MNKKVTEVIYIKFTMKIILNANKFLVNWVLHVSEPILFIIKLN